MTASANPVIRESTLTPSHVMDLCRFQEPQIDQSQLSCAGIKPCFSPTWNDGFLNLWPHLVKN